MSLILISLLKYQFEAINVEEQNNQIPFVYIYAPGVSLTIEQQTLLHPNSPLTVKERAVSQPSVHHLYTCISKLQLFHLQMQKLRFLFLSVSSPIGLQVSFKHTDFPKADIQVHCPQVIHLSPICSPNLGSNISVSPLSLLSNLTIGFVRSSLSIAL